ncbi:hypothetical protein PPGU16_80260 (plasmid) [Paraburkholderia largidicola]|uniref:Uncharacterized protein n=1 Tax=Paraburkholderia largidicola TaxID=3014751 RepID=A0A7I8C331_9BURK|nr:hypothetical protein PPGU16_80260 [Paraburkholderia sp. PGU16]
MEPAATDPRVGHRLVWEFYSRSGDRSVALANGRKGERFLSKIIRRALFSKPASFGMYRVP